MLTKYYISVCQSTALSLVCFLSQYQLSSTAGNSNQMASGDLIGWFTCRNFGFASEEAPHQRRPSADEPVGGRLIGFLYSQVEWKSFHFFALTVQKYESV
jgi:hypothetical protein